MLANSKRIKTDSDSSWNIWNENSSNKKKSEKKKKKHFPVSKFLHNNPKKAEEIVLGPGGGVGIGLWIGWGGWLWWLALEPFAAGYWGWNWLWCWCWVRIWARDWISLESLESYLSKQSSSDSKKRVVIEI